MKVIPYQPPQHPVLLLDTSLAGPHFGNDSIGTCCAPDFPPPPMHILQAIHKELSILHINKLHLPFPHTNKFKMAFEFQGSWIIISNWKIFALYISSLSWFRHALVLWSTSRSHGSHFIASNVLAAECCLLNFGGGCGLQSMCWFKWVLMCGMKN